MFRSCVLIAAALGVSSAVIAADDATRRKFNDYKSAKKK
jgi:hypothetical protein